MPLDADEKDICRFLAAYPGEFVSLREISRRAGGKHRFREEEDWAAPVLLRLLEKKRVEEDNTGRYRLIPRKKPDKPTWVAPHLREILKRSGKEFNIDEDEDDW